MQSLTIETQQGQTRTFEVEPVITRNDGGRPGGYSLTGKRNAHYAVVRYVDDASLLHVVAWGGSAPFPGVVLTDADGNLRQVSR